MSSHRRPTASTHASSRPHLFAVVVAVLMALLVPASAGAASTPLGTLVASPAATGCKVPNLKKLTLKQARAKLKKAGCGKPKVNRLYSSKIKKGRVVKQSPKAKKRVKAGFRVRIWLSLGKKLCIVKKRNKNGKLVTVYKTKIVKKKVRRNGKLVTVKKRVFVYRYVIVKKKVKGKTVKKRVKRKVPKLGPCKKKKKKSTSSGVPVKITISDGSVATIDFGAFQREIPLSGTASGFIVGKGFQLGKDNQINLTKAKIDLASTGIFIDDACDGQVSDSIRTGDLSYTEIDQSTTGNTVNVKPDSSLTGLLHMRVQISLLFRNDDTGCDKPYLTTGWTDFTVPLFLKGKIGAGKAGLTSTINIGETVLDDLSACLALGDPTLPCNGFAIPFPGILSAHLETVVKIG